MAKESFKYGRNGSSIDYYNYPTPNRSGLPIYDSFPEFEVDNWSDETRAKGCTKRKNTYLYDNGLPCTGGMYSDRMSQWDSDKYDLAMQHLANGWRRSSPAEFTAMLCAYLGKSVVVTQVIQMEDMRGFDIWYVAYKDSAKTASKKI